MFDLVSGPQSTPMACHNLAHVLEREHATLGAVQGAVDLRQLSKTDRDAHENLRLAIQTST
eukprot:gene17096-17286_t